jgi:uncharacterized protein (AIM24 family)
MPSDQIDYQLIGDDLQAVIVTLDPEEAVVAEAGAMMYMQDGIRMMTSLDMQGRGGQQADGSAVQAGKRVLAGDSFFVTIFLNESTMRRDVAFASPYPGKIQAIDLMKWRGTIIAQKDAFLCGARGVGRHHCVSQNASVRASSAAKASSSRSSLETASCSCTRQARSPR